LNVYGAVISPSANVPSPLLRSPVGVLVARLGDDARRQRQRGEPDRHVDQEDAAPAEPGDVGLHEQAADQLAADGRQPHREAVRGQRAGTVGAGVGHADDRQDVRHQDRGRGALQQPRGNEDLGAAGDPAFGGCQREERQADREDLAAPELVAEPPGRDQQDGGGQRVAGDDPLDRAIACVQVALHRRQRDVHDEEVQDDHERAGQDDGERSPTGQVRSHAGHGARPAGARRLPAA
jgi:hypothetical protein